MTLFVLLGPTGIGKTELSLELARHLGCPILNCDSRQIYRHMNIGTAAPTDEQLAAVKHYFVHTLELEDSYSAAKYEADALAILHDLSSPHTAALMSGGSMMYLDAVCNGIDDIPTITDEVRSHLKERYHTEGLDTLRAELKLIDPEYYAVADTRNPKRIVHALEVYYTSGRRYSSFRTKAKKSRFFNTVKIGLQRERTELFDRINRRVDAMMENGLLQEAKSLYSLRHLNSLNTVGYKEMFKYLDGEWTLDYAIEKLKKNTRDYAKKQMTWFKHDDSIHWFHPDDTKEIINLVDKHALCEDKNVTLCHES